MTFPRPNRGPRMTISRRQLLARAGALGAAGFSLPALLSACGGDDDGGDATGEPTGGGTAPEPTAEPTGGGGGGGSLTFDNWTFYIDPTEDGNIGTVDRFREATGIDMQYREVINSNNEFFAQIQPVLGRGETIEADIIAPTSWLAGRLISLGWVDPIPFDQIPNSANLVEGYRNPAWDPTGEYSLPWQGGFAGICYNIDVTGRELTSIEDLWDPEFAGRIGINTEMRDTIGLIAMSLGINIEELQTFDDAAPAFERLEQAKADGLIRRFHGNDYGDDLTNGNFAACIGWSGDVIQLALDNPAVRFAFPESGATSWADTMLIPKGSPNRDAAAQWMNFVYDPVEAAQITAYVAFISPVAGVREELEALDPDLANNPLMFPDDATIANTQGFAILSEEVEAEYDAAFSEIIGA